MQEFLAAVSAIYQRDEPLADDAYDAWARDAQARAARLCLESASVEWDPRHATAASTAAGLIHSVSYAAGIDEIEPLCAFAGAFSPSAVPARIVLAVAQDHNRAALIARLDIPKADADGDKAAFRVPVWERPRGHWSCDTLGAK